MSEKKEPHVCPICDGRGWVWQDFYDPPPAEVQPITTTAGKPKGARQNMEKRCNLAV